ncbi:TetR/AcrR family transcriptional regulator [Streptomyces sp. NPDC090306]|uniref:TetR/AcrR family transcriptional regulator n=1 Tax=unclassified Streptomyces TaxID=2593676 RepID=UPI0036E11F6D
MVAATRSVKSRLTSERMDELGGTTLALLREVGYESLTMDAVASRARVSKATLYRLWKGKAELVAFALARTKHAKTRVDTGSLRGDLEAGVAHFDDETVKADADLMRSLAQAAITNPELLHALRDQIIAPEQEYVQTMLRRAIARGEVSADNAALDYVMHMMIGAVMCRELIDQRPPDQAFFRSYVEAVVLPVLLA